jgi:hypothetical protein
LASSTNKKAIIHRYGRETLSGYVNPSSFVESTGAELLLSDGNCVPIPLAEIKTVTFVRDFHAPGPPGPRAFLNRPKTEGLWVRLQFRDGDQIEGIIPNNLLQVEPHGFTIIPPGQQGHSQHIFVPRVALVSVEVLGVIGSPLKKPKAASKDQITLFDS